MSRPMATAPKSHRSAKQRGLTKKHFLSTEASTGVKVAGKISLPLFIVLMAMILIACYITNNTSVLRLPVAGVILSDSQLEDAENMLEDTADQLEDADKLLARVENRFGNRGIDQARALLKNTQKLVQTPSLANYISVANTYEKLLKETDDSIASLLDMDGIIDSARMITQALKIVYIAIYGFGALVILLTLWATTARKTGLCILCILLFCPTCALLSNVLLAVLSFVTFVALAVTISIVNKAWKKPPTAR